MYGKFYRRFAQRWNDGDWEGWTPPWLQREWHGPRFFGPPGPGPWGGPWGHGHGPGHEHGHGHGPGHEHGHGPGRRWGVPPEMQALMTEAAEVARLFAIASRGAVENRDRLNKLRTLLEGAHKELTDMIYSSGQSESQGQSQSGSAPDVEQA